MKKVLIVGLGLMGGSILKALPSDKYTVLGADLKREAEKEVSLFWNMESETDADIVLLCISPRATERFLKDKLHLLKKGAVVSDICGVKRNIVTLGEQECEKRGLRFIGGHPMAGREKSGFEYSTADLFKNRSYILTPTEKTDREALETMKMLAYDIGCSSVTETTPETHDKMIAFTSQVPHVLAGAYMKSPESDNHLGFSAGSYHDVSRVASVDENLWTELFSLNRDNLVTELDILIKNLEEYKLALEKEDKEALFEAIRRGRLLKERDININGAEKPHKFG